MERNKHYCLDRALEMAKEAVASFAKAEPTEYRGMRWNEYWKEQTINFITDATSTARYALTLFGPEEKEHAILTNLIQNMAGLEAKINEAPKQ
jgi:hypothetical protein